MKKIINPCLVEVYEGKKVDAFCEITYEDGNLSICGVIGPKRNGDCYGSCGQCVDEISRGVPVDGWDVKMLQRFCDIWNYWHLNDMRAECEHQRAAGWRELAAKNDESILCKPCPVCGYRYGTSWLKEDVPQDVIDFLFNLPDSEKLPAWI